MILPLFQVFYSATIRSKRDSYFKSCPWRGVVHAISFSQNINKQEDKYKRSS